MLANNLNLREEVTLICFRFISRARLSRRVRVNSFLRMGLMALKGGSRFHRCYETLRSRATLRVFRVSRIRFRELALGGLLPGVRKL